MTGCSARVCRLLGVELGSLHSKAALTWRNRSPSCPHVIHPPHLLHSPPLMPATAPPATEPLLLAPATDPPAAAPPPPAAQAAATRQARTRNTDITGTSPATCSCHPAHVKSQRTYIFSHDGKTGILHGFPFPSVTIVTENLTNVHEWWSALVETYEVSRRCPKSLVILVWWKV